MSGGFVCNEFGPDTKSRKTAIQLSVSITATGLLSKIYCNSVTAIGGWTQSIPLVIIAQFV